MIHLFTDPSLRELWNTGDAGSYPEALARRALAFLDVLDAVASLAELENVPACRTKPLFEHGAGDVKVIEVSPNWRIVFHTEGGNFTGLRLQHTEQPAVARIAPPAPVTTLKIRKPTSPAAILQHFFMEPLNLRQTDLAGLLKLNRARINSIMRARFAISADTASRLERAFGVSAQFWLRLQMNHDVWAVKSTHDGDYRAIARATPRVAANYEVTENEEIPSPQDVESNMSFDDAQPA